MTIEVWTYAAGRGAGRVTAYERPAKANIVYLRWRGRGNWVHRSLGYAVRDKRGRLVAAQIDKATAAADAQSARLSAGLPAVETAPLSLIDGLNLYLDPIRGAFATTTPYTREVQASVEFVMDTLGGERPWISIKAAEFREVWRKKIRAIRKKDDRRGHRGAVVVISRLLSVAQWLRDEEVIPLGACVAPKRWRDRLAADWREISKSPSEYRPERPRHDLDEMQRILVASAQVDPRFHLLLALGAELRLGQVARVMRQDAKLAEGTVHVHGRGRKRGTTVTLTAGQRAVLEAALTTGYLRELEAAGGDFPLFPRGKLIGVVSGDPRATMAHSARGAIGGTARRKWFTAAEKLAGVPHRKGRGQYGLRRAAVDAVLSAGISLDGLKASGGWSDIQMPKQIYEEQDRLEASREAADVRARIRGESVTQA